MTDICELLTDICEPLTDICDRFHRRRRAARRTFAGGFHRRGRAANGHLRPLSSGAEPPTDICEPLSSETPSCATNICGAVVLREVDPHAEIRGPLFIPEA